LTLATGSKLGPYEILSPIGAGGMGEVYRARDPRLGREVAIKVLPVSFSADADRLRRFEQEARAAGDRILRPKPFPGKCASLFCTQLAAKGHPHCDECLKWLETVSQLANR
jgi:serine/threonine protein kinase